MYVKRLTRYASLAIAFLMAVGMFTTAFAQDATPASRVEAPPAVEHEDSPTRVAVVPGNHESLVSGMEEVMHHHWRGYLGGDADEVAVSFAFPWSRRFAAFEVEIIGVSSAVTTLPLLASGRVGVRQMARLEQLLSRPAPGWCRVVLIHHPPSDITGARKALSDRHALADLLLRHRIQLVLHGHLHRDILSQIGNGGGVPVLGVPSLTIPHEAAKQAAAWRSITLSRNEAGAWRAQTELHTITEGGDVRETSRTVLDLPEGPQAQASVAHR